MNGLSVDDKCVPEKAADLDIKDSAVGTGGAGGTIASPPDFGQNRNKNFSFKRTQPDF